MLSLLAYISGLRNNSFNAIKEFKTKVTRSQRNSKDNTKMKYCRWVAGRRLTTGSLLNNLKLEELMFTSNTNISAKV
jgi:hypothetical protein